MISFCVGKIEIRFPVIYLSDPYFRCNLILIWIDTCLRQHFNSAVFNFKIRCDDIYSGRYFTFFILFGLMVIDCLSRSMLILVLVIKQTEQFPLNCTPELVSHMNIPQSLKWMAAMMTFAMELLIEFQRYQRNVRRFFCHCCPHSNILIPTQHALTFRSLFPFFMHTHTHTKCLLWSNLQQWNERFFVVVLFSKLYATLHFSVYRSV